MKSFSEEGQTYPNHDLLEAIRNLRKTFSSSMRDLSDKHSVEIELIRKHFDSFKDRLPQLEKNTDYLRSAVADLIERFPQVDVNGEQVGLVRSDVARLTEAVDWLRARSEEKQSGPTPTSDFNKMEEHR